MDNGGNAMTVSTSYSPASFTANGTQTAFAFGFQIISDTNGNPDITTVEVTLNGVVQSSGFTTVANPDQSSSPGGTVTFSVAPTSGVAVQILRSTPLTQTLSFPTEAEISTPALEVAYDKTTMQVQENEYDLSLKPQFPSPVVNGGVFAYNASGTPVTVNPITAGYALIDNGSGLPPSYQPVTAATGGNVVGPASSISGNLPKFSDTTGKTLADTGVPVSSVYSSSNPPPLGFTQLRAYLVSGQPEADGSSSGNATLYVGPYNGNLVTADNGSGVLTTYALAEKSIALTLTSGLGYSVYLVNTSGTFTIEVDQDWSGNTPPAYGSDALGRATKNGATNKLLVATFVAGGTNLVYDYIGARQLSNEFNPILKALFAQDTTASYATSSASFGAANSNTSNGVGRVSVWSRRSRCIRLDSFERPNNGSASYAAYMGIGKNSTTIPIVSSGSAVASASGSTNLKCSFSEMVSVGATYYQRLTATQSSSTSTFYYSDLGGGPSCVGLNGLAGEISN